jgi:hypothetical protein
MEKKSDKIFILNHIIFSKIRVAKFWPVSFPIRRSAKNTTPWRHSRLKLKMVKQPILGLPMNKYIPKKECVAKIKAPRKEFFYLKISHIRISYATFVQNFKLK